MNTDDLTQPLIDQEVEHAIRVARGHLESLQQKGLLKPRATSNAFSAMTWAECFVDDKFNIEAARAVLERALKGDVFAIEMSRDIVSKLSEMCPPRPEDVEIVLREARRASAIKPESSSSMIQRDYSLALVVAAVTRLSYRGKTFRPTSNRYPKFGRPTPSATWIVAEALRQMGRGDKTLSTVVAARRNTRLHRRRLFKGRQKMPIHRLGLLFYME
jgi:DNA-directed RNA polymerase subunit F